MNLLFWAGWALMLLALVVGALRMNVRLFWLLLATGTTFWVIIILAAL